jgi:ElaA protein
VIKLHVAGFSDLDTVTLYAILRLRADVFVVEQDCAYCDVDGRDLECSTRHVWLTATDGVAAAEPALAASRRTGEADDTNTAPRILAYLRILEERDGTARIARVCVARDARRAGHAATLMAAALDVVGARDAVLDAQTYATKLYEDAGFVRDGADFVEDGIPHLPMRRHAP